MSPCLQAKPTNKSVVELVKEATGASEEDVKHTLEECDYDVNKATNMLIDGAALPSAPFPILCCTLKQAALRETCPSILLYCILDAGYALRHSLR
jgi:GBF-interacting protein 1 N-terminal